MLYIRSIRDICDNQPIDMTITANSITIIYVDLKILVILISNYYFSKCAICISMKIYSYIFFKSEYKHQKLSYEFTESFKKKTTIVNIKMSQEDA